MFLVCAVKTLPFFDACKVVGRQFLLKIDWFVAGGTFTLTKSTLPSYPSSK